MKYLVFTTESAAQVAIHAIDALWLPASGTHITQTWAVPISCLEGWAVAFPGNTFIVGISGYTGYDQITVTEQ